MSQFFGNICHHEYVFSGNWLNEPVFSGKLYRYEPVFFSEISAVMSPFPETLPS